MEYPWRIRKKKSGTTKLPDIPRPKSTEETYWTILPDKTKTIDLQHLYGGGPPRSDDSTSFYDDIFLNPLQSGRRLPELRIPATGGERRSREFYDNVFGTEESDETWSTRTGSMSVTNSDSEDFSPFPSPVTDDDDVSFSVLASKLGPKDIPSKCNTGKVLHQERQKQHDVSGFSSPHPSFVEKQLSEDGRKEGSKSTNWVSCPETICLGSNSYGTNGSASLDLNSPSSSVQSSFCQEREAKVCETRDKFLHQEEDKDDDDDYSDFEIQSSYVIEINSDYKEDSAEAQGLEEAIAWAKEKFLSHSSLEEWSTKQHKKQVSAQVAEAEELNVTDVQIDGCESHCSQEEETPNNLRREAEREMDEYKQEALLEEDVRLWSSGKEENIQLLLSTLHNIICPRSGWYPIPLRDLNTRSNVKKAYQRARLCLHPDKLQQRNASFKQKYVAEKAFLILQEAWATFISQDVIISARG